MLHRLRQLFVRQVTRNAEHIQELAAGNRLEVTGSWADITDRQQTETALWESESRYRQIFNSINDAVMVYNCETSRFVDCNEGVTQLLGYTRGEFLSLQPLDIVHPDFHQCLREDQQRLRSGENTIVESLYCHKDGTAIEVEINSRPMTHQGARTILSVVRDITERKKAETRLQESYELLSLFIKNSPIYTYIKEVTPIESRVRWASANFEQMIGVPSSVMVGKTMQELFPPEFAETITADDWAVVSGGDVLKRDEDLNGRNYNTIKFPITLGGKKLLAGYTMDITERKQAEEKLRISEERYRTLAQNLPGSALLLYDRDLRFIVADGPELTTTGYLRELLEGKTLHEVLATEFAQLIEPNMRRALAGEVIQVEFLFEDRIYLCSYVPLRDSSGETTMAMILANNITERKKAEKKLIDSEKLLSNAQQIAKLGNFVFDLRSQSITWSDEVYRIFEIPIGEPLSLGRYQSLIEAEDFKRIMDAVGTSIETQQPYRIEHDIVMPSKKIKHVFAIGYPVQNEGGETTHIFGIIQDITERKHAEKRLQHSEASLNEAQQLAHLGSWEWNIRTGENIWSVEQYRIFGYAPGSVEPNYSLFADALHPADKDRVLAAVQNTAKTGAPYEEEYRIIRPDTVERVLYAKGTVQCDAQGRPWRVIGVVWDITERKQAEEALRDIQTNLRLALEAGNVGLWSWDLQSNEVYFSPEWKKQIGYEANELRNDYSEWAIRIHPDDREATQASLNAALAAPYPLHRSVFRLRHKDGQYRWILAQGLLQKDEQGNPTRMYGTHVDITDRKQAEQALIEREQRYRTLFDLSPTGIVLMDIEGNFIETNNSFCESLGYSAKELVGKNVQMLMLPETLLKIDTHLAALRSGQRLDHVVENIRKDGTTRVVELREASVPLPEGHQGILATVNDITERKQAEQALQESNARLTATLNAMPDLMFEVDAQGRIFRYHTSDPKLLYVNPEEFLGKSLGQVLPDGAFNIINAALAQAAETGHHSGVIYSLPMSAGTAWFELSIAATGAPYAPNSHFIILAREITEHKKMEELLAQRAAQLEKVANISSNVSAVLEVDELLSMATHLVKAQFGYYQSHIYLLDESVHMLVLAAGAGEAECRLPMKGYRIPLDHPHSVVARVAREKRGLIINDVRQAADLLPDSLPSETRSELAVPLIFGDQVMGVFDVQSNEIDHFTTEDIYIQTTLAGQVAVSIQNAREFAARKQTEEQLVTYTAKLETSNRDLQEFAYVAAHDLQEPLRKVLAFSDRLTVKYNDVLGESGVDYLRRMQDASRRMQTLIDDLLNFSRVSTRAKPFEDVNLAEIARDVLSDLESLIERNGASVMIGELGQIQADPTQIRQLLQNLVGNALKFSHPERPPRIKLSAKTIGGTCQIQVEDNGIGFEPKYLDRIFKPFQRLHDRSEYEGSGMGLAICRRIVERHSGNITATSQPDKGTTFFVTLPVHQMEGIKP